MPAVARETITAIRVGVEAGRTYGEIAADLSVTRNVVAGIVNRHCRDVARPEGTATRRRNSGRPSRKPRSEKPPTPPRPPRVAKAKPVALPVEDTAIECRVIPFVAASGCRWPLWQAGDPLETKTVCGARCADGHPYCAGHFRLAHRNDRRRAA